MEKDILVILMVAFGLFAIIMFILFFVYLKKYYNTRHLEDDYQKELDEKAMEEEIENQESSRGADESISLINEEKNNMEIESKPLDYVEPTEVSVTNNLNSINIKPVEEAKPKVEEDSEMDFVPIKKK